MVKLIVAYAPNGVIGKDGKLPWHLPEDLKLFKSLTTGNTVIMGRKTWESIPIKFRPLSKRNNLVITTRVNEMRAIFSPVSEGIGPYFFDSLESAIAYHSLTYKSDVYIIGGATIYNEALEKNLVDQVILSYVEGKYEGDTFFPMLPDTKWDARYIKKYDGFTLWEFDNKAK